MSPQQPACGRLSGRELPSSRPVRPRCATTRPARRGPIPIDESLIDCSLRSVGHLAERRIQRSTPHAAVTSMTLVHEVVAHGAQTGVWPATAGSRNHMTDQPRAMRRAALRAGWNDGAWRRSRRERSALDGAAAVWYERGYAGGLIYRQYQRTEIAEQKESVQAMGTLPPT